MDPGKFNQILNDLCETRRRSEMQKPRGDQTPWPSSLRPYAKPTKETCGDCGEICLGRVVHVWKLQPRIGEASGKWAKKCLFCGRKTQYLIKSDK